LAFAITNQPFVEGMQPLALSEQVSQALLASDAAKPRAAAPVADGGEAPEENEMEQQLRQLLGLDEKTDVLEAVKALKDNRTVVLSERDTLTARLTEVTAERDDLKRQLGEASRDALLAKYEQEGKLTPAMREAWAAEMALNEPERFTALMDTLPVVVDLTERGSDGGVNAGDVKLTEAEISLGRQLGISEADLLKAKSRA
jgi:phage I-like protein